MAGEHWQRIARNLKRNVNSRAGPDSITPVQIVDAVYGVLLI